MKKGLGFFLIAVLFIFTGLYTVKNVSLDQPGAGSITATKQTNEVTLNEFLSLYNDGTFEKIELNDVVKLTGFEVASGVVQDSGSLGNIFSSLAPKADKTYIEYKTNKPADTSLTELGFDLQGATTINVNYNEQGLVTKLLFEQILPLLFFILILVLAFRFFGPKGGGMPFGIKAGKLRTKLDVKTKFDDVAGMDEVKNELIEIVDFLKHPEKYQKVGAKVPRGVLLRGPPGSGKTLLARAVAGEAGVPFFSASGSEFMEMLVGMGAAKVRELFKKAKAASPAIIFIDEIDSIGKKRGGGYTGGHQEQEQTLNQILTEMDGFDTDSNVIVIAATNRPDTLDSALLRSGRFDRKVMVGNPTLEERELILSIHAKDKKLAKDVDLGLLARRTSGFVGADLANIINEAALKIAKDGRKKIENEDLDYALEKIVMGPEKKIKSLKEKEREIVTYHELGHAVTAYFLPNADPVEKISIVSRGMALGVTWMMPSEDTYLYSKAKFLDELVTLLGGRAAEEVFFGKENITTGASNDFEKVTKIATGMITKYGMDDDLGTLVWMDESQTGYQAFKPFSEKTAQIIDEKIKRIVGDAYKRSVALIKKNKSIIEKMAQLLFEKEYINKDEFLAMMDNPKMIDEQIETIKKDHQKKLIKTQRAQKKNEEKLRKESSQAKDDSEETPSQDENIEDNTPKAQAVATLDEIKKRIDTFLGNNKKK